MYIYMVIFGGTIRWRGEVSPPQAEGNPNGSKGGARNLSGMVKP